LDPRIKQAQLSRWDPEYSEEEILDQNSKRFSLEPDRSKAPFGGMSSDGRIRIFRRPLFGKGRAPGLLDSGPDRLALTILHETIHWVDAVSENQDGLLTGNTQFPPAVRRDSEVRARMAQIAFAQRMNQRMGFQLVSQAELSIWKSEAKAFRQEAAAIRRWERQRQATIPGFMASREQDLPKTMQRSEFLFERPVAVPGPADDKAELLKESAALEFKQSWDMRFATIKKDIAASNKRRAERRAQEEAQQRYDRARTELMALAQKMCRSTPYQAESLARKDLPRIWSMISRRFYPPQEYGLDSKATCAKRLHDRVLYLRHWTQDLNLAAVVDDMKDIRAEADSAAFAEARQLAGRLCSATGSQERLEILLDDEFDSIWRRLDSTRPRVAPTLEPRLSCTDWIHARFLALRYAGADKPMDLSARMELAATLDQDVVAHAAPRAQREAKRKAWRKKFWSDVWDIRNVFVDLCRNPETTETYDRPMRLLSRYSTHFAGMEGFINRYEPDTDWRCFHELTTLVPGKAAPGRTRKLDVEYFRPTARRYGRPVPAPRSREYYEEPDFGGAPPPVKDIDDLDLPTLERILDGL